MNAHNPFGLYAIGSGSIFFFLCLGDFRRAISDYSQPALSVSLFFLSKHSQSQELLCTVLLLVPRKLTEQQRVAILLYPPIITFTAKHFLQQHHILRYRSPSLHGLSLSLNSDPASLVYEAAPPADSTI